MDIKFNKILQGPIDSIVAAILKKKRDEEDGEMGGPVVAPRRPDDNPPLKAKEKVPELVEA